MINFFVEDVAFILKGKRKIRSWILSCLDYEGRKAGDINIVFCSDAFLLPLNKSYLESDTLTDIITFNYSEDRNLISGDIYISTERARENAKKYRVTHQNEVLRLIIHGILHLSGYDDQSSGEKQRMSEKEDYYLSLLPE